MTAVQLRVRSLGEPSHKSKRLALLESYASILKINPDLNRVAVSFQGNRQVPFNRWFRYKEAFSTELVRYFLRLYRPQHSSSLCLLDPFAGAGTALTTAAEEGWEATGIELLPVAAAAIRARLAAVSVNVPEFEAWVEGLREWASSNPAPTGDYRFPHLRITDKAFPAESEKWLAAYVEFIGRVTSDEVRYLLWFAALAIMEDISFTRKDGQYLRWDTRSGRSLRSRFCKGSILPFNEAIQSKVSAMLEDLHSRSGEASSHNVNIIEGSCLTELGRLPSGSFDLVITSPPYCNRYDYTRTYALELAFMGLGESSVKSLRQALLSATVENRSKREQLQRYYRDAGRESVFGSALKSFQQQEALQEVLSLLYEARDTKCLNNSNVPAMVENYFFEMNLVIRELSRALRPGGRVVMVNDNVQYHGTEVPVDLILSDFACRAGLRAEHIWVLPRGKGNSSQQMGLYGRNEIRKCVYVWSKPREQIPQGGGPHA